MSSNQSRKRGRKASGAGPGKRFKGNGGISHPQQINGQQLRFSTTLRFTATAAANATITYQNLLDTILVATTATAGSDVFQVVKIRAVEVWGMPAIGAAGTVAVEYAGAVAGSQGDQMIHVDTSMGVQPAHVLARPSRFSLASTYQPSTVAAAFVTRVIAGSVVDVHCTFRGQFTTNVAAQNALVAATAGAFYLRGLDGLATATTNFVPDYTQYGI